MEMPTPDQLDDQPKINRSGVIGSEKVQFSDKKPSKKNKKQKDRRLGRFLIIAVVLSALMGAGIAIYFLWPSALEFNDPACDKPDISIDKKLSCAKAPSDKAAAYLEKLRGRGVITAGESAKGALVDAYSAEQIYPSADSAMAIASIEEINGNLSASIKYYKLFVKRAPSDPDINYYRQHIIYLEGKI